jgi:hypothetical protein
VEIWSSGGFERFVIAEEHEHISRKATEAEVKVAGFARRILLCKGVTKHIHLTSQREQVARMRCLKG